MHTDIKPKNIMINETIKNNKEEDIYNIKLSEFSSYGDVNFNNRDSLTYYTAPEIFDKKYDSTCDVWSVGECIKCTMVNFLLEDIHKMK